MKASAILARQQYGGHTPHKFSARRLLVLVSVLLVLLAAHPVSAGDAKVHSTSNQPPRKVIVGTAMQAFWVEYPGLEKRLAELGNIVDRMSEASKRKYGRDLDLAVLPETAVTGEAAGNAVDSAVPLEGPL